MTNHLRIAYCRGCGAEIIWALTVEGNRMPLNAQFEGRFILEPNPDGAPLATVKATYISHFATCPQADQFRK